MPFAITPPDWKRERHDWPFAEHSQFVETRKRTWHIQRFGEGPQLLFLHGTGASTHSWAALASLLQTDYSIVLVDLPGHGFTTAQPLQSISAEIVADELTELLTGADSPPVAVVGHSAGAVVGFEFADRLQGCCHVISINGAFEAFGGLARLMAPMMAKMMYVNPVVAMTLAGSARNTSRVEKLISGTGSRLSSRQVELYARLLRYSGHVSGALGMMASWSLEGVSESVASSKQPVSFIVGTGDRAVSPEESRALSKTSGRFKLIELDGGHLVHEEDPVSVANIIRELVPVARSTAQPGARDPS